MSWPIISNVKNIFKIFFLLCLFLGSDKCLSEVVDILLWGGKGEVKLLMPKVRGLSNQEMVFKYLDVFNNRPDYHRYFNSTFDKKVEFLKVMSLTLVKALPPHLLPIVPDI